MFKTFHFLFFISIAQMFPFENGRNDSFGEKNNYLSKRHCKTGKKVVQCYTAKYAFYIL